MDYLDYEEPAIRKQAGQKVRYGSSKHVRKTTNNVTRPKKEPKAAPKK